MMNLQETRRVLTRQIDRFVMCVVRLRHINDDARRYRHMRDNATFQNRNGPGLYWYLPRWDSDLPVGKRLDKAIDDQCK